MTSFQKSKIGGTYRLKFGKHKGEALEDLDVEYLEWLVDNLDLDEYNNAAVVEECQNQILLKNGQGVSRKGPYRG